METFDEMVLLSPPDWESAWVEVAPCAQLGLRFSLGLVAAYRDTSAITTIALL